MRTYVLNCVVKNVMSIFIYNIHVALQNMDIGVLQKSSTHFLISIFCPPGEGRRPLSHPYIYFIHETKIILNYVPTQS